MRKILVNAHSKAVFIRLWQGQRPKGIGKVDVTGQEGGTRFRRKTQTFKFPQEEVVQVVHTVGPRRKPWEAHAVGLYKEGKVLNRRQTKTWRAKTVALIEAHQMHNHGRLHGIFGDGE